MTILYRNSAMFLDTFDFGKSLSFKEMMMNRHHKNPMPIKIPSNQKPPKMHVPRSASLPNITPATSASITGPKNATITTTACSNKSVTKNSQTNSSTESPSLSESYQTKTCDDRKTSDNDSSYEMNHTDQVTPGEEILSRTSPTLYKVIKTISDIEKRFSASFDDVSGGDLIGLMTTGRKGDLEEGDIVVESSAYSKLC